MKYKIFLLLLFSSIIIKAQSNIVTEDYTLTNDSVQLPGTLSFDKSLKSQPLVIFIHGSGPVNKNGGDANYIKQLGDTLNTQGIAFYRYDKRTSNRNNVKELKKGFNFNDFVDDTKIAIDKFKDDDRFSDITLIGHSQGSLIGMLASKNNVDKYVSLAGSSNSIDITIQDQVASQNASLGKITEAHFKELKETGTVKDPHPDLMVYFNKSALDLMKTWASYNPIEEIKKVSVPTLIIHGTRDLNISIEDAEKLKTAKPDSKLVIIGNMNHVLRDIDNELDNAKSYSNPKYKLSNRLVETLIDFIKNK